MPVKKNVAGAASGGGGTFRVLAGYHEERTDDGVVRYGPGESFDSDKPLDVLFANKFVREGGGKTKTKRPRDLTEEADEGGGGVVMDKPGHRAANEVVGFEPGDEEDDDHLEAQAEAEASEDDGVVIDEDGGPETEEQPVKAKVKKVVTAAEKKPVNKAAAKKSK